MKFSLRVSLFVLCVVIGVSGCSVVNFSANYYTPPPGYRQEVLSLYNGVVHQVGFGRQVQLRILTERQTKGLKGIPASSGNTVILPENFVKYVYQNYYNDRNVVLTCVIVHELSHIQYDLPSRPPKEHFKTDVQAIAVMGNNPETVKNYYSSLQVMKDYWFARKGMAGHTFNVGWNAVNAASMAVGGPGVFVDWFATDLNERMKLIARNFKIPARMTLRRSSQRS